MGKKKRAVQRGGGDEYVSVYPVDEIADDDNGAMDRFLSKKYSVFSNFDRGIVYDKST